MGTLLRRRVVPKAASYTIVYPMDAPGTIFTNKGATGAIIFTLPAASKALQGVEYIFLVVVNQNVTVATPVADTMVATNDLAADSVGAATTNEKIGARIVASCVETVAGTWQWVVSLVSVGHTSTITTA